jgi:hypothetical protein
MNELLKTALALAIAEENARIVAERLAGKIQVQVSPSPPTASKTVKLRDINLPKTLIDEAGCGVLRELVIRSESSNYVLTVYVDGFPLYNNSYSWFQEVSQVVEGIDAFHDDESNLYVLRLSNIHFTENLKIIAEPLTSMLSTPSTIKLSDMLCILDKLK